MTETGPLVQQLMSIMSTRLLDPLEILLSEDPLAGSSVYTNPVSDLRERCERAAESWAVRLLGPHGNYAVASIIGALYPGDDAFDPPADWWRTALGQVVLRQMGFPGREAVSYTLAGAMLGVTRQGVHDLVTRNKLARHPDGGVTVTSIRERIQLRGQRS
ncbi:hypothetical protein LWC34_39825 [Kibdelosporangium philippinense]|uniref:MftR C-terminal domain-containing protein n=1 Tax=Kibdelosporangium philippinense TaxID=211113 RepID=A0ABS8ZM94_9PSEU|nr:hypothetical protein [Kibdelosporangium philippinense]MCE7008918.1 hypothetical protein [Kibdelosporangium philippinense]